MKLTLAILASAICWGQCTTLPNGTCNTGLSAIQNNLLGPLTPTGSNPWTFGDAAEQAVIDNMAPAAIAGAPTLGSALSGTVSWTAGTQTIATTANLTSALSGISYIVLAWNTVDGNGTGRQICAISGVTSTTVTCNANLFAPTSSGITAYILSSTPDAHGCTFMCWTAGQPTVSWDYYGAGFGIYRWHYRVGSSDTTYLSYARQYADIYWQWVIDHGYSYPYPRAEGALLSQFFRALEGHTERLPGLYLVVQSAVNNFGQFIQFCPFCDAREGGYALWSDAIGAKVDTDPTRHAGYCSALTTYSPFWLTILQPDGSIGENAYAENTSFVDAVKAFMGPPFIYQGTPWRVAIDSRAMETSYESLNDTSSQGCNNPSIAANVLTAVTNNIIWQHNYGRDTVDRGTFYEINSQSQDQNSVGGTGTATGTVGSAAIVGVGTNWKTSNACTTTPYIGFQTSGERQVYKIASCADDTHLTLTTNYGLFSEMSGFSGVGINFAPSATGGCNSSATYCFGNAGDRNLTRTQCGAWGWLYNQTLNPTYQAWTNECLSATLGGPTAGMTSAATAQTKNLPCSGPDCDGFINDMVASAVNCLASGNIAPCMQNIIGVYANLGKNFGEAWGAPGIDNALAWRISAPTLTCSPATHASPPTATDIQLQINMMLGTAACTNNISQSGSCNLTDVQRVISASLPPFACKIGP